MAMVQTHHIYHRTLDPDSQDSLAKLARLIQPGSQVLDLGCGHGRHCLELARRGHRCVGIDMVPGFIDHARAAAAAEGLACEFMLGDLRAFESAARFDGAVCLFDAFGFHDDADHRRILANTLAALRPGGRLLLDVRTREHMLRQAPVSVVEAAPGEMMIDRFQFDIESGRMLDRRSCVRGGVVRETTFSVRLYAYTELKAMLRGAGFRVLRAFGGFDGTPLSAARPRTLVVAEKTEPA